MTRTTLRRKARGTAQIGPVDPPAPPQRLAVLYARVSSREQEREGFSIPAQQELLRKYAALHGIQIVEEFIDVETAKRTGRVAFGKMLQYLKRRKAKSPMILVEKTDRLYRNLKDWVALDEMNVDIHLVKEGIVLSDDSRSSEKFVHGIKVLMAKNYVDNLSEEVRKGMHQKAGEGYWPSSAPMGYLNRREGGRSFIVPDPERAMLIRSLFELYDKGDHSVEDLAEYAVTHGYRGKRGGKIASGTIHMILRNPLYAGRFQWGGKPYVGKDPTLISWALFERVQARLDGHPYTRPQERTFAYTGMFTCAYCGSSMTAMIKKERYIYYLCAKSCRKGAAYLPEKKLSDMIMAEVGRLRMEPATQATVVTALRESRRDIEADVAERMKGANMRIERLGRLISRAYDDKLEGSITDAFFQEKRAAWEAERASAAREIEHLTTASARCLDLAVSYLELGSSAWNLLSEREPLERRELLEVVFLNCTISDEGLSVTWRRPFDLLAQFPGNPERENGDCGDHNRRHQEWSG
jgi:site-specific DNA recombinase